MLGSSDCRSSPIRTRSASVGSAPQSGSQDGQLDVHPNDGARKAEEQIHFDKKLNGKTTSTLRKGEESMKHLLVLSLCVLVVCGSTASAQPVYPDRPMK